MMTESEIKMYSDKYAKMREHSVFCLGGSYFDYDRRNDIILNKFKYIVESKSELSIDTKDPHELQCLRFLAMRELSYRTEDDGVKTLKIGADDARRKKLNLFEEMAENPYVFHAFGIKEQFAPNFIKNMKSYKDQMVELNDEAKITIN